MVQKFSYICMYKKTCMCVSVSASGVVRDGAGFEA